MKFIKNPFIFCGFRSFVQPFVIPLDFQTEYPIFVLYSERPKILQGLRRAKAKIKSICGGLMLRGQNPDKSFDKYIGTGGARREVGRS